MKTARDFVQSIKLPTFVSKAAKIIIKVYEKFEQDCSERSIEQIQTFEIFIKVIKTLIKL